MYDKTYKVGNKQYLFPTWKLNYDLRVDKQSRRLEFRETPRVSILSVHVDVVALRVDQHGSDTRDASRRNETRDGGATCHRILGQRAAGFRATRVT